MQGLVSDKTFHLKWNNHLQNLSQLFTTIYSSSALADVTLSCRDGTLKAHKLVLSACSPYFEQIFRYITTFFIQKSDLFHSVFYTPIYELSFISSNDIIIFLRGVIFKLCVSTLCTANCKTSRSILDVVKSFSNIMLPFYLHYFTI